MKYSNWKPSLESSLKINDPVPFTEEEKKLITSIIPASEDLKKTLQGNLSYHVQLTDPNHIPDFACEINHLVCTLINPFSIQIDFYAGGYGGTGLKVQDGVRWLIRVIISKHDAKAFFVKKGNLTNFQTIDTDEFLHRRMFIGSFIDVDVTDKIDFDIIRGILDIAQDCGFNIDESTPKILMPKHKKYQKDPSSLNKKNTT
jgi:hypothetical protein